MQLARVEWVNPTQKNPRGPKASVKIDGVWHGAFNDELAAQIKALSPGDEVTYQSHQKGAFHNLVSLAKVGSAPSSGNSPAAHGKAVRGYGSPKDPVTMLTRYALDYIKDLEAAGKETPTIEAAVKLVMDIHDKIREVWDARGESGGTEDQVSL